MPAADTPRSEQCVGCRVTGSVTLAVAAVFLWRTPARSRLHRAVLSSVSGVLGVLGVARAADLPPFRQ